MAATVKKRRHTELAVPATFEPRWWDTIDSRFGLKREIRRRLNELRNDAGIDCVQKEMLAERAVFVQLQLETMEVEASESGKFDAGVYVQAVNCLSGLLSKLGLKKALPKARELQDILDAEDD